MSDFLDDFVEHAATPDKELKQLEKEREKNGGKPTRKKIEHVNPVRYSTDNNPDVTVVIDKPHTISQIRKYANVLSNQIDSFQIVSALDHDIKLTSSITRYYRDNGIDPSKYIKPRSRVLACGRGMYIFTRSSDLDVKSFYDQTFNKTWFYAPRTESFVFPADNILDWAFSDSYQRYFAKSQLKRLREFDVDKADIDLTPVELKMVRNPNGFLKKWIGVETEVAWDLETKGLDPWATDGFIICLTLSFDGKTGYYLPFDQIDIGVLTEFFRGKKSIGSNLKFDVKWLVTRGVDRDVLEVWGDTQHLGHILNEMRSNGLKPLAWLYTTLGGYDEELDRYMEKYPQASEDYSLVPTKILREYATIDPIASYRIHKMQEKQIAWIDENFPVTDVPWLDYSTWTQQRLYREIIIPAINTFIDIELEGMTIDIKKLRETSKLLDKKLAELKQQVLSALGADDSSLNINSPEKLGKWIQGLGWSRPELAKKGHYKTNDKILQRWADEGHEAAKLLIEYRSYDTLMKTFVGREEEGTGFFQYLKPDGKVHPNFGVGMADSLRSTCSSPNLQNISKHFEFSKNIRSFFIPPSDEYVIGESDGASLQLTLEAQLTGDENMTFVFTELGGDMHSMTAQETYRPDLTLEEFIDKKKAGDKEIAEVRFDAKAVNFSLIFGTTALSFAKQSLQGMWTLDQAKEYIEKFDLYDNLSKRRTSTHHMMRRERGVNKLSKEDEAQAEELAHFWACADYIKEKFMTTYPGVASHIERSIEFAEKYGYIRSPFATIRRVPQLVYEGEDDKPGVRKNLKNITVNSPIQSMEAVRIYHAMNEARRKIKENNLKTRLVGMVHDSILSFKHRDEIIQVSQFEKEAFEQLWPENKGVPLKLEVEIADPEKDQCWGFAEEIDVPPKKVRRVRRSA